jgi:putative colanic acid biosynthesis glycosyltransferase WcaI
LVRVTFLNLFYPPDVAASGTFVASLAGHRSSIGDDVTVVCGTGAYVEGADSAPSAPRGSGPRLIRLWTPGLGRSNTVRRLGDYLTFLFLATVRVLALPRQDVIVAMTSPPFALVAAVAHRLVHPTTRVVFWCHDVYPDAAEEYGTIRRGGALSRTLRRLQRWLLTRTDHVVALDEAMLHRLLSRYASGSRPTGSVIPNWEPLALFPPDAVEEDPWPGYADPALAGRDTVLYLGNLGYGHPVGTIAESAEVLDGDGDVSFLFVGGGVRYPELIGEVRRRGLGDVVLRDYVPKETTPSVLRGAIAVLISLDDGSLGVMSPCKLHGGLATGRPVIYIGPTGTNVDDAIEAYGCGFSLRQGDVDGVVDAVRRLRDDRQLRDELGRNARKAFEEAYCDARTLPRFDALFDEVSARRRAPEASP